MPVNIVITGAQVGGDLSLFLFWVQDTGVLDYEVLWSGSGGVGTMASTRATNTAGSPSKFGVGNRGKDVLQVSPDQMLTRFRRDVLSAIGFQVVSVQTVAGALYEISFGRCGVLLLCHRLNSESRNTVAEYFHEHCPEPYIVAILAHEDDHCPPQAHARIVHSEDPSALVSLLRDRLAA